jgi:hypothetical protein
LKRFISAGNLHSSPLSFPNSLFSPIAAIIETISLNVKTNNSTTKVSENFRICKYFRNSIYFQLFISILKICLSVGSVAVEEAAVGGVYFKGSGLGGGAGSVCDLGGFVGELGCTCEVDVDARGGGAGID